MKKRLNEYSSLTPSVPMSTPPKGRPMLQKGLVVLSLGVMGCAEKSKNTEEDVKPEINANAESVREQPPVEKKEPEKTVPREEPRPTSPFLQGATPPPTEPTPPPTGNPLLVATTTNTVGTVKTTPTSEVIQQSPPPHPTPPHPNGWGTIKRAPHPPPPHPHPPHPEF